MKKLKADIDKSKDIALNFIDIIDKENNLPTIMVAIGLMIGEIILEEEMNEHELKCFSKGIQDVANSLIKQSFDKEEGNG